MIWRRWKLEYLNSFVYEYGRSHLVHFNKIIPTVDPFAMAGAGEQVLCKDWGVPVPGPPVAQPAEVEQLKSCRNLPTAYRMISYKLLPRIFLPQ